MKRFALVCCVAGLALADSRPPEPRLTQELNGEVSRTLNSLGGADGGSDGGGLSLWTTDAGIACNYLSTGSVYEMHCDSHFHFCPWGDGGCSTSMSSQAYGTPHALSTPAAPAPFKFIVTSNATAGSTKLVCAMPATGDADLLCAAFKLK